MIGEVKSELLDLASSDDGEKSYYQWFTTLRPKLDLYFGIKQSDFLIYSKSSRSFRSIQGDERNISRQNSIPIEQVDNAHSESRIQIFRTNGFEYTDDYLLFYDEKINPLGILLVDSAASWREFSTTSYRIDFEKTISGFIEKVKMVNELKLKERKFRHLYNVTEFFNSTMESQLIIDGMMNKIYDIFPALDAELLLTQDQKGLVYTYKLFDHTSERASTVDAFLTGEITVEKATGLEREIINIPIKGRQGTYGLLQIKNSRLQPITTIRKNFIWMLANAAGSALENASLYDQSHRLIEDLRLINETSRKLNGGMQVDEMFIFLKKQLITALHPDEVGFVLRDEKKEYKVIDASTELFRTLDGERYIQYVNNYLSKGRIALFDADLANTENKQVPFKAIIGIPIMDQEEKIGFVICLHRERYFFSFDGFKLMQSLIGHSALALTNLLLRNQLRELAEKDHLTGLYSRRYLEAKVEQSINENSGGALLLLDIDDFKNVNDTYGHDVGDKVLKKMSNFISKEILGKGIAARWGGEEVAIYFPKADRKRCKIFSEKLIADIPTLTTPSVTVSAGMANWQIDEKVTLKELFKQTDTVLYEAKSKGKNRLVIHKGNRTESATGWKGTGLI